MIKRRAYRQGYLTPLCRAVYAMGTLVCDLHCCECSRLGQLGAADLADVHAMESGCVLLQANPGRG